MLAARAATDALDDGGPDALDVLDVLDDGGADALDALDEASPDGELDDRAASGDALDPTGDAADRLALLDAERSPTDASTTADASFAAASAGASEAYEAWVREHAPRWGRLDVGLSFRRSQLAPLHATAHQASELWLVATWRR